MEQKPTQKAVYCHFAFRRKQLNNKRVGLFATALYADLNGKNLMYNRVTSEELWLDNQLVAGIQAYERALNTLYELQGQLKEHGVSQVYLVTNNDTLLKWIYNHKCNKKYMQYLDRAVADYKELAVKEIKLKVGLCEPQGYDKAYKFCDWRYIEKERSQPKKNILDLLAEDEPKISGVTELV